MKRNISSPDSILLKAIPEIRSKIAFTAKMGKADGYHSEWTEDEIKTFFELAPQRGKFGGKLFDRTFDEEINKFLVNTGRQYNATKIFGKFRGLKNDQRYLGLLPRKYDNSLAAPRQATNPRPAMTNSDIVAREAGRYLEEGMQAT
jgi:hypothetical protein